MNFRVEVSGLELTAQTLNEVKGRAADWRRYWPEVVDQFQAIQRSWFDSQGRGSWVPLSPSYAAWKAMVAPGNPLLVLNGDLRSSEISTQVSRSRLELSIDAPYYWFYHQYGTRYMPARPPYVIDREMQDEIASTLAQEVARRIIGL